MATEGKASPARPAKFGVSRGVVTLLCEHPRQPLPLPIDCPIPPTCFFADFSVQVQAKLRVQFQTIMLRGAPFGSAGTQRRRTGVGR